MKHVIPQGGAQKITAASRDGREETVKMYVSLARTVNNVNIHAVIALRQYAVQQMETARVVVKKTTRDYSVQKTVIIAQTSRALTAKARTASACYRKEHV